MSRVNWSKRLSSTRSTAYTQWCSRVLHLNAVLTLSHAISRAATCQRRDCTCLGLRTARAHSQHSGVSSSVWSALPLIQTLPTLFSNEAGRRLAAPPPVDTLIVSLVNASGEMNSWHAVPVAELEGSVVVEPGFRPWKR